MEDICDQPSVVYRLGVELCASGHTIHVRDLEGELVGTQWLELGRL